MDMPMDRADAGRESVGRLRNDERAEAVPRDDLGRPVLSFERLARSIDHRLHRLAGLRQVLAGAAKAQQFGVAAVTCRPEHVAAVAAQLEGSGVGVTSAVEFHDAPRLPLRPRAVIEEGIRLAEAGATDVGVIADAARAGTTGSSPGASGAAQGSTPHGYVHLVAALCEALQPFGTRVRAHIDVTSMSQAQAARTAQAAAEAGASMVQVGTWRQDWTSFPAVQATRRLLRPSVPVKWTSPVRSLPLLLFAFGEGVDRFNVEDLDRLLADARRASMAGPLLAPIEGLDY